jgi:hypothetical protein
MLKQNTRIPVILLLYIHCIRVWYRQKLIAILFLHWKRSTTVQGNSSHILRCVSYIYVNNIYNIFLT